MSQHQFDVVRACFWLVAFVIGAHVFVVLAAEVACLWHFQNLLTTEKTCGTPGALAELLGASLAAALAFAGGRMSRPSDDKPEGE